MTYTNENRTKILSSYIPDGSAFVAKNITTTNLYKFLDAIALNFVLFSDDIIEVYEEMDPATTEDLINRWEQEYGIPDGCLDIAPDIETRRQNILIKIGMSGVQTVSDFEELALKFGVIVNVFPASGYPPITFPLAFPWLFMTEIRARFTIIVELPTALGTNIFPFSINKFPFPFSVINGNIIECVFRRLVPANVDVIFRYIL